MATLAAGLLASFDRTGLAPVGFHQMVSPTSLPVPPFPRLSQRDRSVPHELRRASVSTPRSANRTCGFAASGSRRRLTQSPRPLHVTPPATSENSLGVIRLIANLPFCRRFLRPPSTEAPSLHRSYPASSVLRASPPSQSARPVSHELPVDPNRDHRWDFPCCVWSPFACMPSPIPRQVGWNLFARTLPFASAFPETGAGRLLH